MKLVPVDGDPFDSGYKLKPVQGDPFRQPNREAMRPRVDTPFGTIQAEADAGFNPAAAIIKAGGVMESINRGIHQAKFGPGDWLREKLGMKSTGVSERLAALRESDSQPMKDLQEVHPGSTLLGDLALTAAVPWRALPAVAASEYGDIGERALKGGSALAGNVLATKAAKSAAARHEASQAQALKNAETNVALAPAREAGYAVSPAQTNPTLVNRALEGLAGGTKTEQALSKENQKITTRLVKEELGIPASENVTIKTLESMRASAGKAYADLKRVPAYATDEAFHAEVAGLRPAISAEMPELANPQIDSMVRALSKDKFSGETAVELIKRLRYQSNTNFKNRMDPEKLELAQAQRGAAEALEGLIDRRLAEMGNARALAEFRAARERIAKSYDAERALIESTGDFAAKEFAKLKDKRPLSGNFRTIADFAERFPKSNQVIDSSTKANPFSVVDFMASGIGSAAMDSALPMAGVFARPAIRAGLLSQPYQRMMTIPSEKARGALSARALDSEMAPFIAGLLGYHAAN